MSRLRGLGGPIVKSVVFIIVTALATTVLALVISNGSSGGGRKYSAIFTDATSVQSGDDVRMAGVRVGQVSSVSIVDRTQAKIEFSVDSDVRVARTVTAAIHFRNLIGQRYLELDEGNGSLDNPLPTGSTIPLTRTTPALDLTVLFNGFEPLFQALAPKDINLLSGEIIQVFQGEGPTVDDLLTQTASLTTTLADKDAVIGSVIDNLNSVLDVVNKHGGQLTRLVTTLQSLVSGLAEDRRPLGEAITGIAGLTKSVAGLLHDGRRPLKNDIASLGELSKNLADQSGTLNSFLQTLPGKLNSVGRIGSYGSWLNFYLCSVGGRIPVPADFGNVDKYGLGTPDPTGLVGIANNAARCVA